MQTRIDSNSTPNIRKAYSTKGVMLGDAILEGLEPNEYPTGNYIRLILRTAADGGATEESNSIEYKKDNVIEDCEDYIDIDKLDSANNVTKILYMGDSRMYMNDIGGQLAALTRKANRKIAAVCAYGDGKSLSDIIDGGSVNTTCWSSRDTKLVVTKGEGTITEILSEDYLELERKGKWDYIVVPGDSEGSIREAFKLMSHSLSDSKNFIIFSTSGNPKDYSSLAKELKCSVISAGTVWSHYSEQGLLSINGGDPSGVKQYLSACILYAKFFGATNLTSFIPLYNTKEGNTKEFYKAVYYNDGGDNNKCYVDEKRARELQHLVAEHYEDGVLATN